MKKLVMLVSMLVGLSCFSICSFGQEKMLMQVNQTAALDLQHGRDMQKIYNLIKKYESSECEVLKIADESIVMSMDNTYYQIDYVGHTANCNFATGDSNERGYNISELSTNEAVSKLSQGYIWLYKFVIGKEKETIVQ